MKIWLSILLTLCLCSTVAGQDDFFDPPTQQQKQTKTLKGNQLIDGQDPAEGVLSGGRLAELLNGLQIARDERKKMAEDVEEIVTLLQQTDRKGLLETLREMRDNLKESREANKGLLENLREAKKERKGLLEQLADARKERQESWREWRKSQQESWRQWREEQAKTQGRIRQTLSLLVKLIWAIIIFAGVVGLGVGGIYIWGKLN